MSFFWKVQIKWLDLKKCSEKPKHCHFKGRKDFRFQLHFHKMYSPIMQYSECDINFLGLLLWNTLQSNFSYLKINCMHQKIFSIVTFSSGRAKFLLQFFFLLHLSFFIKASFTEIGIKNYQNLPLDETAFAILQQSPKTQLFINKKCKLMQMKLRFY